MMRAQDLKEQLKNLGNREQAAISRRFFKTGPGEYGEGDVFIGIKEPVVRKLVKEYPDLALQDVKKLLRSKIHEERLLSLLIMVGQFCKGDQKKHYQKMPRTMLRYAIEKFPEPKRKRYLKGTI